MSCVLFITSVQESGVNGSRMVGNGVMETSLIIENPALPPPGEPTPASNSNGAPRQNGAPQDDVNNGGAFHIVNPLAVDATTGAIPKSSRLVQNFSILVYF
jgi:hypothetical protein